MPMTARKIAQPLSTRPLVAALPSFERDFAPELHRHLLRARMILVDDEVMMDKKGNTADAKQKRNN